MRFGLDIHGTIDSKPIWFAKFSSNAFQLGHQIHIITGARITKELIHQMNGLGICFTHMFSISDYLIREGHAVTWKTPNNPMFDEEIWNCTKAQYCQRNGIDLMIDDSDIYGNYFSTPYMRVV